MGTNATRQLQDAIRRLHGCDSLFVEAVPVTETFRGEMVWSGIVHVFDLIDCQEAERAYAWAELLDGRQRFVAVLHKEPVTSPRAAVQASIVQRAREEKADG